MIYKVQGLKTASSCFVLGSNREGTDCPLLLITIGEGMKLKGVPAIYMGRGCLCSLPSGKLLHGLEAQRKEVKRPFLKSLEFSKTQRHHSL